MASKAELAREEAQAKKIFYGKILQTVFDATFDSMVFTQKSIDFKIKFTGRNRYIRYSIFGFKMSVLIYTRGEVVIEFDETCHGKYEQKIYEYSSSIEGQAECLGKLRKFMYFLIPLLTQESKVDAHTFMDYIDDYSDIGAAIDQINQDWK